MSYLEDIETLLADFTESERVSLIEKFGINLLEPSSISHNRYQFKETRKRIREIERKALKKLHPSKKYTEPEGPECSLCGITESEVNIMAKHESGFSICNECIELCAQVIRENVNK